VDVHVSLRLDFYRAFGMIFPVNRVFPHPAARPVAIAPREDWSRSDGMPTGTVKWFNSTKGYGFIAPDDGGKDVFVHISAVERAGLKGLNDNQKIGFELQSGRDGKQSAGDLRLL
jgi:CspA family cold shock protein